MAGESDVVSLDGSINTVTQVFAAVGFQEVCVSTPRCAPILLMSANLVTACVVAVQVLKYLEQQQGDGEGDAEEEAVEEGEEGVQDKPK